MPLILLPCSKDGYYGVACVCWEHCKDGWVDEGALCRKKGSIETGWYSFSELSFLAAQLQLTQFGSRQEVVRPHRRSSSRLWCKRRGRCWTLLHPLQVRFLRSRTCLLVFMQRDTSIRRRSDMLRQCLRLHRENKVTLRRNPYSCRQGDSFWRRLAQDRAGRVSVSSFCVAISRDVSHHLAVNSVCPGLCN